MSFFTNPLRAVYDLVRPTTGTEKNTCSSRQVSQTQGNRKKRSAIEAFPEDVTPIACTSTKKHKKQSGLQIEQQIVLVNVLEDTTSLSKEQATPTSLANTMNLDKDRTLMPPPATPTSPNIASKVPRDSLGMDESASQITRSTRITRGEVSDEYNMEEARRRAAATQLPPNSGIWEPVERELFFHLAYRGFEPLLPNNWMIDFPTLPLSVFAHQEDDEPLIKCHRSTEFRAIKALRELMNTGTAIRARKFANCDLRCEPLVDMAIKRYLKWAFRDLNMSSESHDNIHVPVHTIVSMRPKQNTQHVLRQLSKRMHVLAQHYKEIAHVHNSIETSDDITPPSSSTNNNNYVHTGPSPGDLPVIYGFMICSSIVALFTLNSHMVPPPFLLREMEALSLHRESDEKPDNSSRISSDHPYLQDEEQDGESGIRYIAQFDFSDADADVWNTFVVVIAAMQIRKTMALVMEARTSVVSQEMEQGTDIQAADESWLSNLEVNHELESDQEG